jgi:hypothetical protein
LVLSASAKKTCQALILDRHKVKNDIIFHALTPDEGRLSAVARFARNSKKRQGSHLETFSLVELCHRPSAGGGLSRVDHATVIESFPILKRDLIRMAMAHVMAEIILGFTRDAAPDPALYILTLRAFSTLNDRSRRPEESLLVLFELRALQYAGFLAPVAQLFGEEHAATAHLERWLQGEWSPMTPELARTCSTRLEAVIEEQLGRALRARPFLDESLDWRQAQD